MVLSDEAVLVYFLAESGVKGRLSSGRIERRPSGGLDVFDARGEPFEYLSGGRIRSWCVLDPKGMPIAGWQEIQPEDLPFTCA
jgi:hypothetical protein